jgi:hypothetical protein
MAHVMSEEELMIREFDSMVKNESEANHPTSLFEDWSDDKKINYMNQLQVNLPEHTVATDLDQMNVPVSRACLLQCYLFCACLG